MYAIKNKITGQWLYGTNYRGYPPIQRISNRQALIFETLEDAECEFKRRECGKDYKIVEVKLLDIKEWIELECNQF